MRKNISLSIKEDDLKHLDYLCKYLSDLYAVRFSRTSAINFLIKRYYYDVIGANHVQDDEVTRKQLKMVLE